MNQKQPMTDAATAPPLEGKAGLSPAKLALLKQRLKKAAKDQREKPIGRRKSDTPPPLSHTQELLWLVDQLTPNSVNYTVPRAMRLVGDLNREALQQTLNEIVRRHEILRTVIKVVEGKPVQIIRDTNFVPIELHDLTGLTADSWEPAIKDSLLKLARRPFRLSEDLLLRADLLLLGENEHILLLDTHHIASDGWSKGVLFKELSVLYEAFCQGAPSPLPELPIQYADFAVWQRESMDGPVFERQLAYWQKQLAGAPALLEFPNARPRPATQSFRGSGKRFDLPKSLLDGVKALGQREGTSLFITLLAGFNAFLHRYTRQEDIVLGTPIAGRNRPEMETLIGYFTNTLALRTDLSGDPTFRELLRRVKDMALAAYDHQDFPFESLVVELKPERNLSYSPIFQVLFSVGHAATAVPVLGDLKLSPVLIDRGTARFDLIVGMTECPDTLAVGTEFSTDLFDEPTVSQMIRHFGNLLASAVEQPEKPISQLRLLDKDEEQKLLVEWNSATAEDVGACIHHLIEAQVERTPDAVAIISGGESLSYRELNARANQLARHLVKLGVGPDAMVGICVERSLEMGVGLLGVLKAGAACVPLDPSYPAERLQFMLHSAHVPVLLTQERLVAGLPGHQTKILCLDSDWEMIGLESEKDCPSNVTPEHLAYVIFTSGSTGRPKGVLLTHRGLVNHNLAAIQLYNLKAEDRVLQFSSISFDIAIEEVFPTWMAGGTLVLRPAELSLAGKHFSQWVEEQRLTVLDLPTAYWHEWTNDLAASAQRFPSCLRLVIVGGEKASAAAFAKWVELGGDRIRWINTYGPTETSVVATAYEPDPADYATTAGAGASLDELPIGRPLPNVQVYLLDEHGQSVPIGVPGELHIGGAGLARGYLDRPELTSEKFIPNPFVKDPKARLYKTGDLARFRRDGNIEYVGRADHQVKLRGYRIELGEIEAVLEQFPQVREAVVAVREDAPGSKRLVGYVVPREPGSELASGEVRAFLKDKLPEYMVPSAILTLPSLPMTPNGKVDRKALPAPEPVAAEKQSMIPPRDALDVQLKAIWENVLGVKPVSLKDNFFELGGHSMLAVRLFGQIERSFGKDLPLATLFQAPTLEGLADILRQDGWTPPWTSLVPIQAGGSKPPLFFAHGVGGNVLNFHDLARHLGPDQPVYGLQSRGLDGKEPPFTQVEAMAAHYVTEILALQPEGPYYLGGMSFGGMVALEMAQQLKGQGHEVALLAMLDTHAWGYLRSLSKSELMRLRLSFLCRRIIVHSTVLWKLSLSEKLNYFRKKFRTMRRQSRSRKWQREYLEHERLGRPLPQVLQDVKEANYLAAKNYFPKVYPGRVTVFRAKDRLLVSPVDPQVSWRRLAGGGVTVMDVPGDHLSMVEEPNVGVLAERIKQAMEENVEALNEAVVEAV